MPVSEYPVVQHFGYKRWPECAKGIDMEFRLVYSGSLPSQPSDNRKPLMLEKHAIRRIFHPQLRELWSAVTILREWQHRDFLDTDQTMPGKSAADIWADNYALGPFRFLPLVTRHNGLACALDILFLRRDGPGNLVVHGGDIDNRIKVLFDALRRPKENSEIQGLAPDADENPFYCLMDDDSLITDVRVTTDRLLSPVTTPGKIHDVVLVLTVKLKVIDLNRAPWEFLGQ
jgi:hypothetical protein